MYRKNLCFLFLFFSLFLFLFESLFLCLFISLFLSLFLPLFNDSSSHFYTFSSSFPPLIFFCTLSFLPLFLLFFLPSYLFPPPCLLFDLFLFSTISSFFFPLFLLSLFFFFFFLFFFFFFVLSFFLGGRCTCSLYCTVGNSNLSRDVFRSVGS